MANTLVLVKRVDSVSHIPDVQSRKRLSRLEAIRAECCIQPMNTLKAPPKHRQSCNGNNYGHCRRPSPLLINKTSA